MRPLLLLLPLLPVPALGQADITACGDSRTAIAWTQPPRKALDDPEATRWPVDATIRIAYGGTRCPSPDEFELEDEAGGVVPAQVRIETPPLLAAHDELPLTLIEVDPVPILEPRATYRLVWRAPEPKLASFENFTLEFKTLARDMLPLPFDEFEGILAVGQQEGRCGADLGNPVLVTPEPNDPPGCVTGTRVLVQVRFRTVNRRDVAYVIERTSSTPLDAERNPITAEADTTPIAVAYIGGGEDFFVPQVADGLVRVPVPDSPMPRRDCFAVRMLDAQGLPQGGEGEACTDMPFDFPCLPSNIMSEAPSADPVPVLACPNIGLNGADPNARPPADGPDADGGVDAADGGNSDGCCRVVDGVAAFLVITLLANRRRRGGSATLSA